MPWNQNILAFEFSIPLLHGPDTYHNTTTNLEKGKKSYSKEWELEKETTFAVGKFKTISGHFFANYIIIFHKT